MSESTSHNEIAAESAARAIRHIENARGFAATEAERTEATEAAARAGQRNRRQGDERVRIAAWDAAVRVLAPKASNGR